MKIFDENGKQLGMSDILYKCIEGPDDTLAAACMAVADGDITEKYPNFDYDDCTISDLAQFIGSTEPIYGAYWEAFEQYFEDEDE